MYSSPKLAQLAKYDTKLESSHAVIYTYLLRLYKKVFPVQQSDNMLQVLFFNLLIHLYFKIKCINEKA